MKCKKVLICNIFGIGDVLFTTPLIRNLKLYDPEISIGYLCNDRARSVLESSSDVQKLFIYDRDLFVQYQKKSPRVFLRKFFDLVDAIKAQRYDWAIDTSMNSFIGFIIWLSGIRQRTGLDYKNRGFFLNQKIPFKGFDDKHVAEYFLDLLRMNGIPIQNREMCLPITDLSRQWVSDFFRRQQISAGDPVVGILPGGGESWGSQGISRRWNVENYVKLADKIVEKHSARIILMGSSQELDLCQTISKKMRQVPVLACGQTDIAQLAALLKACTFNVINDSGPVHIAKAVGAKMVSIYGPVDELIYGPYPTAGNVVVTNNLPCRPCYRRFRLAKCDHRRCLGDITVEQVYRKVEQLL